MNQIQIRLAKLEDAERIAYIHITAWQETYKGILPDDYLANMSYEKLLRFRKHILTNPEDHHIQLVAIYEGEIAGFCNGGRIRGDHPSKGEIYSIHLLDQYKRLKIGSALWYESVKMLKQKELPPYICWALEENLPARKFYEQLGGVEFGSKLDDIVGRSFTDVGYIFNE